MTGTRHVVALITSKLSSRSGEALQLLCRRRPDGRVELHGYSLLYPLTDDAGRAIAEARTCSAGELGPEAILPDFASARYLYIGHPNREEADACAWVYADQGLWRYLDGVWRELTPHHRLSSLEPEWRTLTEPLAWTPSTSSPEAA